MRKLKIVVLTLALLICSTVLVFATGMDRTECYAGVAVFQPNGVHTGLVKY